MLTKASARTRLSDFGEPWFRRPLAELVESINAEAELTPVGRILLRTRIENLLANRLRAQAFLKAHPEIRDIRLGPVIVIAGPQRSGTTFLQRLLGADPNIRALLAWEALNPVPLPGSPRRERRKRIRQALWAERGLKYLAPEFFAVHPIEHDAPEEDILLLDQCFMGQTWEALVNVPGYSRWLGQQDLTRAYEYLRSMLQLLLASSPGKTWILKSPQHAAHLELVLKIFPQATIVLTHRDPVIATASFLSMVAHARGIFSDRVDAFAVGEEWAAKVESVMRRSIAARRRADPARFVDVSYYDLLKNPLREVRRIFSRAGIELTDKGVAAMGETLNKDRQHRYGLHRYDLESFGLREQELEERLGFYREEYGIPHEQRPL